MFVFTVIGGRRLWVKCFVKCFIIFWGVGEMNFLLLEGGVRKILFVNKGAVDLIFIVGSVYLRVWNF